jgi:hypothetical protein
MTRPATSAAAEVMDLLTIRLHHMASGTKRPVQFVDSPLEPGSTAAADDGSRREDLLAKINAIETSHPSLAGERSAERIKQIQAPAAARPSCISPA